MSMGLDVYLVGGAVRDELLGVSAQDRDWVVVGAAPEELVALGYRPVGKEFPVFLHPRTGEQYALARTERKVAPGYRGFNVHAAPGVTLHDDLRRRDLTINAMARDPAGRLIDPFGGRRDLAAGRLRHVSDAFGEDPVRILRVARFAARFANRGFTVAPDTLGLMQRMVVDGEVDALVADRVWMEFDRALGESTPSRFIEVLRECGALARLFAEINALFGVPQPARYHPEIDTGAHTLLSVDAAARLSAERAVRYAALVHDLGKALTPPSQWPRHIGHEQAGLAPIRALGRRVRAPKAYTTLAELVCRHHLSMHRLPEMTPAKVLALLEALDAIRRPARLARFALACEADMRGRHGRESAPYPPAELLFGYARAAGALDLSDLSADSGRGPQIAQRVRERRLAAIVLARNRYRRNASSATPSTSR